MKNKIYHTKSRKTVKWEILNNLPKPYQDYVLKILKERVKND